MKTKTLLSLCFALFLLGSSYAETEPNNTPAQANTLTLNGSASGAISPSTDVDWFKVTTTADGQLNLTLTSTNGLNVAATLYDNNAATSLNSAVTAGVAPFNTDGLAAGTYYIKITTYYAGQTPAYTIANTLAAASVANDAEPDSSRATALTLALNTTTTGHTNYYYQNHRDTFDFYKITTNGDGLLQLKLTSSNGSNVSAYLFDNDATTVLASVTTTGTGYANTDGLAAGTYYVRINSYYNNQFEPYTLTDSLFKPSQSNDTEPDSTRATALTLALNGTTTGHINYYYNHHRDSSDFYKITTNGDGLLQLKLSSNNGSNVSAYLFDNDGIIQLGSVTTTGTGYLNTDGLAAGTYYVRINSYYNNQFEPYTLTDSLFKPAQANDLEPDSSRATALTLPQNSTVTGHINYYYKNHRDSADFYKISTDGDGLLQLKLTSHNGNNVSAYLFDNDGTTVLGSVTTTSTGLSNSDGLAAGTYYVRVNSYYNNQFEPYTLTDSLFKPAQANDLEPDSSRATALTLPQNSTTTGHINYFYKNHRDSLDFYKIIINVDGLLQLKLTSHNGNNVSAYLYDNDGTTVLGSVTTTSTGVSNTDGLAAGTYYVRINSYYNNQFETYTLTDSLLKYSFASDLEPNKFPYQAKTMLSNKTNTGHTNFYYNLQRDSIDWHKINYTGTSGNMKLFYGLEPNLIDGGIRNVTFQVYKDTLAAPISNLTTTNPSSVVSLTGLTQGYYYIRVNPYYNNQFESYSILDSFVQVNKASISVIAKDTANACDSTNSITFKCSGSHSPYSVQLYRYGVAYGSPLSRSTSNFQITNLPQGSYYAIAYGDGATGTAFGKSAVVTLVPRVGGTSTTNITQNSAQTNWTVITCAKYYTVQYHKAGESAWLTQNSTGNTGSATLNGLAGSTTYRWRVQAVDSANNILAKGAFTDSLSFTTTGGSSLPLTLEAEDAVLSGAVVASNQPGFTGTGFADYAHASGDYIEWTANVPSAGSYSLKFRYANGASTDRPLQLTINGVVVNGSLSFLPTGSFATWSVSSTTAGLIAGNNTIRLTTNGANGANLDNLVVDVNSTSFPLTLEAEDAVLNGPAIASNQPGFTGTGFADYAHASGDYIEWTANIPSAGSYSLQFRYANGGSTDRPLQLMINGSVVNASLSFSPTGSFATWSISSTSAALIAGNNTIRLTTIGSNGSNVDNLVISNVAPPTTYEAEVAVLHGAVVAAAQPGFTGTGYADYTNASGDYIEWTVNAAAAGAYSLQFRYANGASTDRPLQLMVNGAVVNASLSFSPTGSFATWSVSSSPANLNAGNNTIRLTTIGSNGANVDNLVVSGGSGSPAQMAQRFAAGKKLLPSSYDFLTANVAPNPVTAGTAKLIVSTSLNLPINFQLVDMLGRNYQSFRLMKSGSNTFDFSVNGLSLGSYFIVIKQGNLTTHARLIVGRK